MQPTAKWKQHQTIVNVSLWPLISGKAKSWYCRERRGVRAASPRQRSRVLRCYGMRSWALAGCRHMAAKAVQGGQTRLMPGLLPWVGHPCSVCGGCSACERYRETFLGRIALGWQPWQPWQPWQAPRLGKHLSKPCTRVSVAAWGTAQQRLAAMTGSEAGAQWGPGLPGPCSWAHSWWPSDAFTRSLHKVGSHLAKRTGNLDDLELLWPPVLDDFPLLAASLTA